MEAIAPWGLGLGWFAVAIVTLRRGAPRAGAWLAGLLGIALAGCAALRWHVTARDAVRALLHEWGLYGARGTVKLGLFVAAIVLALLALWRGGAFLARQPGALRVVLVVEGAFALFLLLLTGFLDDVLPRALLEQPGRALLELGFLLVTAVAALALRPAGGTAQRG